MINQLYIETYIETIIKSGDKNKIAELERKGLIKKVIKHDTLEKKNGR